MIVGESTPENVRNIEDRDTVQEQPVTLHGCRNETAAMRPQIIEVNDAMKCQC